MKKFKYSYFLIFIIMFLFNITYVSAISKEEGQKESNEINKILVNSFKTNEWLINSNNNVMEIKIPVSDGNIKNLMNDFKSSKVFMYGCSENDNCTSDNYGDNFSSSISFTLKNDNNVYFLYASYVNSYDVSSFEESSKIYYEIENKTKKIIFLDILDFSSHTYKDYGSFNYPKSSNVDESTNPTGTIANPKKIGKSATINVPKKDDDFWQNNTCYYFQVTYKTPKNDHLRYKITSTDDDVKDHTLSQYIFFASDFDTNLSQSIIEDDILDGVYGLNRSSKYAICDKYGVTYTFTYYDDESLTVNENNEAKQQLVENQNGPDSYKTASSKEIEAAKSAINGEWDPKKLCDGGRCNLDITKFCTDPYVARTLKFLGLLIAIAKILVPAIIIILGFIDLAKIVISGKVDEAKKQGINIIKRVVIGIVIFLIPTILITIYNVAYSIANDSTEVTDGELNVPTNFKNCVDCILDATGDGCVVNAKDK